MKLPKAVVVCAFLALVATAVGASVVSSPISSSAHALSTNVDNGRLPGGLVSLVGRVIVAAKRHDAGAMARLLDARDPTDPAVLEEDEVLAMPGAFDAVVRLLADTRPTSEAGIGEYTWTGGLPTINDPVSSGVRRRSSSYDGIQANFFLNGTSWAFWGLDVAPAGTLTSVKPYRSLVGEWIGHDRGLWINPDGSFTLTERSFRTCGQQPEPCDSFVGNEIIDGANATGHIAGVAGDRAKGLITFSTTSDWPTGPVTLSYEPATDSVIVSKAGDSFCGPHSPAGYCGA